MPLSNQICGMQSLNEEKTLNMWTRGFSRQYTADKNVSVTPAEVMRPHAQK